MHIMLKLMNENAVILALIAIIAGLAATLTWVVKEVFKVVKANTDSHNNFAKVSTKMTEEITSHTKEFRPALALVPQIALTANLTLKEVRKLAAQQNRKIAKAGHLTNPPAEL